MPLTNLKIQKAKPKKKQYKLFDGERLYIIVKPNGNKLWKMDHEVQERVKTRDKTKIVTKRKTLSFGAYPIVSLQEARLKRLYIQKAILEGRNPSAERKLEKLKAEIQEVGNSFEEVAMDWLDKYKDRWTEKYARDTESRLRRHIFPYLGDLDIKEIKSSELLLVLRKIENKGILEMASKCRGFCGQIFRYGIAIDKCEVDITYALRGALKKRKVKHHARLKEDQLAEFFKRLEDFDGLPQTRIGIKLIMLTMVRTTELRAAIENELDFNSSLWKIPAGENGRMKVQKGESHLVPLTEPSTKLFKQLVEMNSHSKWLLPQSTNPDKYISENDMLYAMYRLGYHSVATIHGMRGTAATILNENKFRREVVDMQLAHFDKSDVSVAYNDALYLDERVPMMNWWADYLVQKGLKV